MRVRLPILHLGQLQLPRYATVAQSLRKLDEVD